MRTAAKDGVVCDTFYRVRATRGTGREMASRVDFNSIIFEAERGGRGGGEMSS
jgi:hypothetical protein